MVNSLLRYVYYTRLLWFRQPKSVAKIQQITPPFVRLLDKYSMRTCNQCHQEKPLEAFRKSGNGRSAEWTCRDCVKLKYANSPKLKERAKWRHIKSKFKLNKEQWTAMFDSQDGKCDICSTSIDHSAHVDHCHSTNKIRGLLCAGCNKGLGYFRDSADTLVLASQYLKRFQ